MNKEQKAADYTDQKWSEGFFNSRDEIKKDFLAGYQAKESEGWISEIDKKPPFGVPVYVYCRIYGHFIATYERLIEGSPYGNWKHGDELGVLPPTHWHFLPTFNI